MDVNIAEVAAQAIAFAVVFLLLRWKAWRPIQKALEERREKIKSEFDRIEEAKKEIESLKAEYHAHLQKIEEEARGKIQQAIEEGRRIAREIQEKARTESQATFEKTKENLEIEIAKARKELRTDIAELALSVSERILKEKMADARAQEEKVLSIIEELERSS